MKIGLCECGEIATSYFRSEPVCKKCFYRKKWDAEHPSTEEIKENMRKARQKRIELLNLKWKRFVLFVEKNFKVILKNQIIEAEDFWIRDLRKQKLVRINVLFCMVEKDKKKFIKKIKK